ncbi:MAG: T9SS type A sorting domain-containing protein [Bacteroidales bacterium]|nr:T9SS type A sorting domain-containing protein [Bacteroidales bacterium]
MRKKFLLTMLTLLFVAMGSSGKLFAQTVNVAKVGNTEYATIDEAIAAWTNGNTLTLLADVTLSKTIELSSIEHHILDLGTYTMTAASGKDAIQIVNNGRTSASYALDIKADATNPGGIKASGKAVVKTTGKSGVKDRPIIRFYNGVFTGTNVVYHSGSNGTNCPQFWFYGGEFNGTVYANRALFQFYGGTFNGSLQISVDSSAYALIAGGKFKQLSNLSGSALNSDKFTIGSAKGVYDREVYIDNNGNYVIAAAEPAEGIEADVAKTPGTNDYLKYSKVGVEGQLPYTNVEMALKNNTSATVTVYANEVNMAGINFKGTIVVPAESTLKIENAPANLKVTNEDGETITPNANGTYSTIPPVAKIGECPYYTLADAINYATNGQTITLINNVVLAERVTIPADKTLIIDLNGKSISMEESIIATAYAINNLGNLTITDGVGDGSINAHGIYNGYGDGGANVTSATITVLGGTFNAKGTNGGAAIFNYGTANVNGGTFTSIGGYSLNNQAGASMTIADGVTANNGIYASGATLVVNGGEISGNRSGCHVLYAWNSTVTINGGEFYNNNSGNSTTMAAGTTELTITGGTFGIKDGRVPGNGNTWTSCLTDTQNSATMTVNGGTFNGGFRVQGGTTMTINGGSFNDCCGSGYNIYGTAVVKGGTFTDAAAKNFAKSKLAEGYELNADGTVTAIPVAEVNGTKYTSIEDALAAATAGSEIKLLANIGGDITVPANVTLNGNGCVISGGIFAEGDITFAGVTTAADFDAKVVNTAINIPAGASLQLTGSARLVIGHGATFNITGTIEDAKTADKATLVPSLKIAAGASITGNGVTFNVNNAYIVSNANTTSKNSNANGTLDFNINNSIWEQTGVLAFYVPTSGKDPVVNFELKNSVLTTTSHLVFSVTKGEIVIDNSLVNQGTSRQIENRSTMTIKNGSVVNGAVATSSNAINPGTIIVENATYAVTGEFSGAAEGTGTLIIKKDATVSAGSITKANIVIDAAEMTAGELANFTANLSNFAGELSVINNDDLEAKIVDGKIVLALKPEAMIGETPYETLAAAFAAAQNGDVIIINRNVTTFPVINKAVTFKGGKEDAAVEINYALSQNFTAIEGTVKFENLTFNKPLFTEQGGTKPGLSIEFESCNFNVPSDQGYAILIGTSNSNSVVKGLKVNNCNFKYVGDVFKGGYMLYVQCVNEVTITNNTIDGNNLYRGAIHLGDATEHATVAIVSNNTIKNFCRGVMMGNRVAGSSVAISGNTFDNINYSDKDSKPADECAPIFIHSNANAEALKIALTNNAVTNCNNPMIYSEDTDLVTDYVTEFTANTVNGTAVEFGESCYNAPNELPVVAKIGDKGYQSLQKALNDAAAGTGNVTVTILKDINLTGNDWNPVTVSAPGYPVVTVEGNYKTIEGLNDMLFAGTWAGNSGLIIKNLTIKNSAIVNDKDDAAGNVGVGAFVGMPQASSVITLDNCHLVNSTVEGGHWTGGLIGYAAGYAGTDGPVFMNLTVTNCKVAGSTIKGKGSVGGIIGHGSGNAWTMVEIQGTTVSCNTITSTGSSVNKAGAIMGTIGAAGQAYTVNGVEKQGGALVAATVSGNTVTSNGTAITTIYGRQGTSTGVLELNGGSYDNYPIEEGVAYAKPAEGFVIKENEDGTFGVKSFEGEGTAEQPYMIKDLEDLIAFRNSVNSGAITYNTSGVWVALGNDIDMVSENWTPIGTEEKPFVGNFDGKDKTINNININIVETEAKEGKAYIGLFGYAKNVTIKNVVFENVNLNIACLDIDHSQGHIGAVAGSLEGTSTIENVTVKGVVKVEATFDANGASRVAVVAGGNSYGNVTMKNVHVNASENSYLKANNNVGALAGQLQGKNVFENCSSNIDVTGKKFFAGGIIGLAAGDSQFTNCHTTGDVTVTAGREGRANDQYRVGGIAGGWADGKTKVCTLTGCTYTGKVSGTNADGSVAKPLDYAGYVGRGYTLNGCAGSKVVIDGREYIQASDSVFGVYEIGLTTPAALMEFAAEVNEGNTFAGKTVKLTNDIDLASTGTRSESNWTPIGTSSNPFKGTFDGQDHTISNLVINGGSNSNQGFFGCTTDGEIKNVTFNNAKVSGRLNVGVVAGTPYTSKYTNVEVKGHVEVNGMAYVGGVGGKNAYANWENITVNVDEESYVNANSVENGTAYRTYVGGVIGFNGEGAHTFKNISSNIKVIGSTMDIGGVFGIAHYSNKFENIKFTGAVEAPADAEEVGGIAGVWHNEKGYTVTFTNCESTGKVKVGGVETEGYSIVGGAYNAANETSENSGSLIIDGVESWLKVAKINDDKYLTLQAAINNVKDGETITLLSDVNVTTPAYGQNALNYSRAINSTIDLNGKTLSANTGNSVFRFNIADSGATSDVTVKMMNGTVVAGADTWCAVMAAGISADVKAIFNLEDITINGSKAGDLAVKSWANAVVNANNVTIETTNGAGGFYAVGGEIVLNNCTVNQKGLHTAPYLSMAFAVSTEGKMTINSGTYSSEPTAASEGYNQGTSHGSWVGGVMNSGGTLIINGGTFSNDNYGDNSLATAARGLIFADTKGIVEVNGGTFNALKSIFDFQNNLGGTSPVITVKGGEYNADPRVVTSYGSIVIPEGYPEGYVVVENTTNGTWVVKQVYGTQTREFTKGWNWFSSYINLSTNNPTNSGLEKLETALGTSGIQIKGQTNNQSATYEYLGKDENGNELYGWIGSFTPSVGKMYMVKTSAAVEEAQIYGDFVDYENTAIALNKGWNWISYPLNVEVEINEALKDLEPEEGDVIKMYGSGFAEYYIGQWWPTEGIETLKPGLGYMYKSAKSTSFVYSADEVATTTSRSDDKAIDYRWTPETSEYAFNMSVIATLNVDGEMMSDGYEIAAFANGECRGSARPIYIEKLGQYMLFLTIYGDEVEELTFKCYDVNYGTEYELSNRFNYSSDAVLGSMAEPYMFNMNFLNIEESSLDMINIYPNPTTTDRAINLQATCDNVEVFNALGVKVAEYQNVDTIDALETAGVYVIRLTINGETRNCRLVVK